MFRNRGQNRVPSFALILLINELMRTATTYGIPTVTLGTIISQILFFLQIIPLDSSVGNVCLSFDSIVNKKQYLRLILSQLSHADDWHLYYNMVSFLWKGRSLETRLGSVRFAVTLIVFTISTAFMYCFVNKCVADITEDFNYLYHCSVGFSGVIFALKVLTTHFDRSQVSYFIGLPIGSKYAVWAELVLIQMISPNASFVGHLAGILVGLAYIYGPLSYLIEILMNLINPIIGSNSEENRRNYRRNPYYNESFRQSDNRSEYVPNNMSEEEQLRRAYEESLRNSNTRNQSHPTAPPYPTEDRSYPSGANSQTIDPETLRQLRLRRYQNF